MCGISGILALTDAGRSFLPKIELATKKIEHRGPDGEGIYKHGNIALGHRRLSIIDLSKKANQPFRDIEGRYTLVYNGELYNYLALKKQLLTEGEEFKTNSDTEVLFKLLIRKGTAALNLLNGFFSFAFYDSKQQYLLICRDRFGIKPLHYYLDKDKLLFGSEIKSLLAFGIEKQLDRESLYTYLQLTYVPPPHSMYQNIKKLEPGTFMEFTPAGLVNSGPYYRIKDHLNESVKDYASATTKLTSLVYQSVQDRLIADVPLGSFLSGGLDSSIISGVAAQLHPGISTFSMGFEGDSYYDETKYAEIAARKFNTNHTSYSITQQDLINHLMHLLNNMDEPFADSSALAVSILSQKTRKTAKVALSGDGADELFAGYNKHKALLIMEKFRRLGFFIENSSLLLSALPLSQRSSWKTRLRQVERLGENIRKDEKSRYWNLASFQSQSRIDQMLLHALNTQEYKNRKEALMDNFNSNKDEIAATLQSDLKMVLPGDMLTKVDRMSMLHGLEVRVPFLDHNLVAFAYSLPSHYKINKTSTKRILRDAFKDLLPDEIIHRSKQGFEVPMEKWFKEELSDFIHNDILSKDFIQSQHIFDFKAIEKLHFSAKSKLSKNDINLIWILLVFNNWWKTNFS